MDLNKKYNQSRVVLESQKRIINSKLQT